jgi:hypothetical protein
VNKKKETVQTPDEFQQKAFDQMGNDKLMCAQDICVTEDELYKDRGTSIYIQEDRLYYQKYEMTKTILLQKIVEKNWLQVVTLSSTIIVNSGIASK